LSGLHHFGRFHGGGRYNTRGIDPEIRAADLILGRSQLRLRRVQASARGLRCLFCAPERE
jgi:hypothetical protein